MATTAPCELAGVWTQLTVGVTPNSPVPSPRAGHTLVYDAESNTTLLFGGASHEHGLSNETFVLQNCICHISQINDKKLP